MTAGRGALHGSCVNGPFPTWGLLRATLLQARAARASKGRVALLLNLVMVPRASERHSLAPLESRLGREDWGPAVSPFAGANCSSGFAGWPPVGRDYSGELVNGSLRGYRK